MSISSSHAQFIEYKERSVPKDCIYIWRSGLTGKHCQLGYPMLGLVLKKLHNGAKPENVSAIMCVDIYVVRRILADLNEGNLKEHFKDGEPTFERR